jgi:hypothetical protein
MIRKVSDRSELLPVIVEEVEKLAAEDSEESKVALAQ